ncbi:MAG: phytanoyl-CoA dioxygenase family protein [Planctomycetes bacterium]|nr:phytanoyl-CoA dioxygenase family protein [Planctomycetota bacterium]
MHLTPAQIESFHEKGYLAVEGILGPEDLQPVEDEYARLIDERARQLQAQGKLKDLHADQPFLRRLALLAAQAPEIAGNLDIMQARGPATFNFLKNPKILDLAESFVGGEIVCNPIQHIRATMPHRQTGTQPTPWHQDIGVCWPDVDPYFMLTVWIPLVDATVENGCLEVLPDSHRHGLKRHASTPHGLEVPAEERPAIEPMPIPVHRGGAILFHNYTLHHARPNVSDQVRWSFDLRYHDVYQPTGRPFYPAFLFRSRQRPAALETDYGAWCRRWEFALEASKGAKFYRWS